MDIYNQEGYNVITGFDHFGNHKYGKIKPYKNQEGEYLFYQGKLTIEDILRQYSCEKAELGINNVFDLNNYKSRIYLYYDQVDKEVEVIKVKEHTEKWNSFHHLYSEMILHQFSVKTILKFKCINSVKNSPYFGELTSSIFNQIVLGLYRGKDLNIVDTFKRDRIKKYQPTKRNKEG